MATNSGNDASTYWRDKYLSLLDNFETLEAQQNSQYEVLRRGLVVTSLLAEGQTHQLDPLLRTLRSNLKPEALDLFQTIDELSSALEHFDQKKEQHTEVLLGQITDVAEKLAQCPLPKPLLKRVRKVAQTATKELESYQGYGEQLQQWIQLLGEITLLPDSSKEQRSAWWKQWFNRSDTSPVEVANVVPSEPVNKLSDFANYAQDIGDTLNELLDQLSVPDRLLSIQHSLKQRLSVELEIFQLVPLLEDTSEFVLNCLETSQVVLEEFLQNLDQRLEAIRDLVHSASQSQLEHSQARTNLDDLVRDQLSDIRSIVTGSTDLRQLGLSVGDHLTLILQALEQYRLSEEVREQQVQDQIQQLHQRLNEMEQEINASHALLEDQRRKASTDSLTGLPNREAYQQRLIDEHARFHRYQTPLSLIVCDVDHFKHINDTYGHLAGDKVLQLIARTLQRNIREIDFICRFGGEEFVILMPGATLEQAYHLAERLRKNIEKSPFNFRRERVFITLSCGVAEFKLDELPDDAFERADKALYQSKARGRNATNQG